MKNIEEMKIGHPYTDGETIGIYSSRSKVSETGKCVTLVTGYMDEQAVFDAFPIASLTLVEE